MFSQEAEKAGNVAMEGVVTQVVPPQTATIPEGNAMDIDTHQTEPTHKRKAEEDIEIEEVKKPRVGE